MPAKKPLPQEEQEAITEWFIHEYWPTYPGKWCRGGKGSRSTCLRLILEKWQPNEQERRRILGNLKAQILHNRKLPEGQRPWWKMCDTYTRNGLWEDEIESIDEPIKKELSKCNCGAEVHGPRYNHCTDCLLREHESKKLRTARIEALEDLGLLNKESTYRDVIQACKERGSANGKFSLARMFGLSQTSWIKPLEYNKQKT